ncbi:MAG: cytochrome c oxidase assembly protein subunit 11 [Alteromonadaceae bacterium]|jgi:cytochrome c oxidase assembly protein subunit 11
MQQTNKPDNGKLTRRLVMIAIGMFGFGFALVPIYDVFCEVTGLNGKTNTTAASAQNIRVNKERTVTVEFIGITNKNMPWQFKPEKRRIQVHPGEVKLANFYAKNESGRDLIGQAVPSVSPGMAATHFNKIECFCFNRQPLAAGAETLMPLTFYVDVDLPLDIDTLTLSYTMYDVTDPVGESTSQTSHTGE